MADVQNDTESPAAVEAPEVPASPAGVSEQELTAECEKGDMVSPQEGISGGGVKEESPEASEGSAKAGGSKAEATAAPPDKSTLEAPRARSGGEAPPEGLTGVPQIPPLSKRGMSGSLQTKLLSPGAVTSLKGRGGQAADKSSALKQESVKGDSSVAGASQLQKSTKAGGAVLEVKGSGGIWQQVLRGARAKNPQAPCGYVILLGTPAVGGLQCLDFPGISLLSPF
ncbi:hypothetical protein cyc_08748 [Cyclospora cayetanensis]|uniref:Uncharacterized protein n=1 Tax=Cyclospora cayetanensis TaxID=88456 RepID=A0A1D3CZU0_9EIME|nr:hypothetical protein cyc_08748 [Cyclospora cayetanensis]